MKMEITSQTKHAADYLTPQELAAKLSMSLKWVTKYTQARKIPGQVKIGRLWRYNRAEIEKRLLSGNEFLLQRHG
jgi:excisionase family DNA binding protein